MREVYPSLHIVCATFSDRQQMAAENPSAHLGFGNLCYHIGTCLENKIVPNKHNILAVLSNADEAKVNIPECTKYLKMGGTVERLVLWIIACAIDEDDVIGNGEYMEMKREEIAKLPKCRNDREFGFVSGMCGYKRIAKRRDSA